MKTESNRNINKAKIYHHKYTQSPSPLAHLDELQLRRSSDKPFKDTDAIGNRKAHA